MSDEYMVGLGLVALSILGLVGGKFGGFNITLDVSNPSGKYTWFMTSIGVMGIIIILIGMVFQL